MSVTLIIVIVTSLISIASFNNPELLQKLVLRPYDVFHKKEYYRMVTSGFVHGSWMHLLINMYVLYNFGELIERNFESIFGPYGKVLYVLLYFFCVIIADLVTTRKNKDNYSYASLGASGATSGIIFVYVLFYPWRMIYLYAILGIPSIIAAVAYLIYSSWAANNSNDNINHDAHFYGALAGVVFTILIKPSIFVSFFNKLISEFPL